MNNLYMFLLCLGASQHYTFGQTDPPDNSANLDIHFVVHGKTNNYNLRPETLQYLDPSAPTIFIVHGFISGFTTDFYATNISSAYRDIGYNSIFVDWTGYQYAFNYPLLVLLGISDIGTVIAQKILMLQGIGFDLKNMRIVGFSVGADIAGLAGRYIREQENATISRITGLEPAGPLLWKIFGVFRNPSALSATDADVVDVTHTNTQALGTYDDLGTINFYVNGGMTQPICDTYNSISGINYLFINACSHIIAELLYRITIGNGDNIYRASSRADSCDDLVVYGDLFDGNATGTYYLRTETEYPFKSIC